MEPEDVRESFCSNFTDEKYQDLLKKLDSELPSPIGFRIAESPLFLTDEFRDKLIDAGTRIIDFIVCPDFKQIT
jgi:hypothetical protein